MSLESLSTNFASLLVSAYKSEAFNNVRDDLSEAFKNELLVFWKKIRSTFVKEDKTLITQLEKGEIDNEVAFVKDLSYEIKRKIRNDNDLFQLIESFLEESTNKYPTVNIISNSGIVANRVKMRGKYVSARDININKKNDI